MWRDQYKEGTNNLFPPAEKGGLASRNGKYSEASTQIIRWSSLAFPNLTLVGLLESFWVDIRIRKGNVLMTITGSEPKREFGSYWKTKMLVVYTDTVPRSDRNKRLCVAIMRWSDEQGSYHI